MKQFLYQLRPTRIEMITDGPTQREAEVVGTHFSYLQQLVKEGVVLMAGRTQREDEKTFGVVVFQAESELAARRVMDDDPAVINQVMEAQLFPFRVAMWSDKGPSAED